MNLIDIIFDQYKQKIKNGMVMKFYQGMKLGLYSMVLLLLSVVIVSCGTDSTNVDTNDLVDGLSPQIWDIVDEELLSTFEDSLSMIIHRGDNPPDIVAALLGNQAKAKANEGVTVVMKPFLLVETLVPNDPCADCNWYDLYIMFNEQDVVNNEVTIRMRHYEEPEIAPEGGFISGDGNNFSVFIEQTQDFDGQIVEMVSLYSGTVTSEGISDPQLAGVMVENSGVPGRIPNGTGRSYKDGDDLAEISEWPEVDEKIIGTESNKIWSIFRVNFLNN